MTRSTASAITSHLGAPIAAPAADEAVRRKTEALGAADLVCALILRIVDLQLQGSGATTAVWSPDGALIATASSDHTARVWDSATGALLATFRHPDEVMSVQWSRDGARLLTGCHDGGARIWDVHRFTGTAAELDAFIAERVR